jgi:hypothetical protein
MNTLAFDFATKHQVVADKIIGGIDDDELELFALDLMTMYMHAARRLRSELGVIAMLSALHEIVGSDDDWNRRHAAALILGAAQLSDISNVDAELRQHGAEALEQRMTVINATDRTVPVISSIPAVFRVLLPELNTPDGLALLEHFVVEEL